MIGQTLTAVTSAYSAESGGLEAIGNHFIYVEFSCKASYVNVESGWANQDSE
jgi:hypothetical protein